MDQKKPSQTLGPKASTQTLVTQYGVSPNTIELYDPAGDIAATKSNTSNSSTVWPGVLSQAELALNELRQELERQESLERNLQQMAQVTSDNLKTTVNGNQNLYKSIEAETEKLKFSMNDLSNLQSEIHQLVEELNSMKSQNFKYIYEQQYETNLERERLKNDYDMFGKDYQLLSDAILSISQRGVVSPVDSSSLYINNYKPTESKPDQKSSDRDSGSHESLHKKKK